MTTKRNRSIATIRKQRLCADCVHLSTTDSTKCIYLYVANRPFLAWNTVQVRTASYGEKGFCGADGKFFDARIDMLRKTGS